MVRKGENIYKRKDGRWEGRYIRKRRPDGSIHYGYVYHKSYTEVRKQLLEFKLLYKENYSLENRRFRKVLSFEKWALRWISSQESKVRPNTFQSYLSKLQHHLIPLLGSYDLSEITTLIVQKSVDQMSQELATSSVRTAIRILNTCLNSAVTHNLIITNPAKGTELPRILPTKVRAFTLEEQRCLEYQMKIDKKFKKEYSPIYIALHMGLRIGEVAGLCWKDVDWVQRTITVQRNLQRVKQVDNSSELQIGRVKTDSSYRVIPLNQSLYQLFEELYTTSFSEFIFPGRAQGPVDPRTLRYRFAKLKQQSGVADLAFHALRHTFATRCIEKGVAVTTISALLGHHSTKMTLDIYTNSFLSEKRYAMEQIEM